MIFRGRGIVRVRKRYDFQSCELLYPVIYFYFDEKINKISGKHFLREIIQYPLSIFSYYSNREIKNYSQGMKRLFQFSLFVISSSVTDKNIKENYYFFRYILGDCLKVSKNNKLKNDGNFRNKAILCFQKKKKKKVILI